MRFLCLSAFLLLLSAAAASGSAPSRVALVQASPVVVAGTPIPTRMSPRDSNMLYAARRASTVETFATGEFAPSTVRKIGSVPLVASKRAWMPEGEIPQLAVGSWQVPHERPFTPSDRKNWFWRSNGPSFVYVAVWPNALSNTRRLFVPVIAPSLVSPPVSSAAGSAALHAASTSIAHSPVTP